MLQTKNPLPESLRQNVVNLLQKRLADNIDLLLQVKQAHWNVRGPDFIALHELFDRIHEEVEHGVDLIAERITQFAGIAEGTCKAVAKGSSLPDYPLHAIGEREHVESLSTALAAFSRVLKEGVDQTTEWGDPMTADILIQISRTVDKNLWFVESHLYARAEAQKMKSVI